LRERGAEDVRLRLDEGERDLWFFALPIAEQAFETEPLFDEPLWLALPKSHHLAGKPTIEEARPSRRAACASSITPPSEVIRPPLRRTRR